MGVHVVAVWVRESDNLFTLTYRNAENPSAKYRQVVEQVEAAGFTEVVGDRQEGLSEAEAMEQKQELRRRYTEEKGMRYQGRGPVPGPMIVS